MSLRSTRRPLFFWLALLAVLLNALAPSVSHALAASRPQIPVDVCGVHGGQALATAAAILNQQDRHGADAVLDDCAQCLTHCLAHGGHALPPPVAAPFAPAPAGVERPFLFFHAPRPLLALAAAPPRGPPAFA